MDRLHVELAHVIRPLPYFSARSKSSERKRGSSVTLFSSTRSLSSDARDEGKPDDKPAS